MAEQKSDGTLSSKIDARMAKYYEENGIDDYHDESGVGKFKAFCDANDVDDDTIRDDLEGPADQSILVDFDDAFPVPGDINEADKSEFKLRIINNCARDPKASSRLVAICEIAPDDLKVSAEDIEETKTVCAAQLQVLFDAEMENDLSILHLLAAGRKMNQPYLLLLADVYTRKRIAAGDAGHRLSVSQFVADERNKHFAELANLTVQCGSERLKYSTLAKAALQSYLKRICPVVNQNPVFVFVADLEQTCTLMVAAAMFVRNQITNPFEGLSCPFQFDLCFAMRHAKPSGSAANEEVQDDEKRSEFKDAFGDIAGKLKSEQLPYHVAALQDKSAADQPMERHFGKPFKTFIRTNEMDARHKSYPHKRRICAIVDGGNLVFFEPPQNCRAFPQSHMRLWYFDSSRTCILPNRGYAQGKHKGKAAVTSLSQSAMTLSFHVESADEIRCYLSVGGGVMRFMPQDLIKVMPKFFDMAFEDNAKWAGSPKAQEMVQKMASQLRDAQFDAFYKASFD